MEKKKLDAIFIQMSRRRLSALKDFVLFFFLFSFEFYSAIKHLIPVVYLWPARARSSISAEKCIVPRARSHL